MYILAIIYLIVKEKSSFKSIYGKKVHIFQRMSERYKITNMKSFQVD